MNKSKLVNLLNSFTLKERNDFEIFIKQEYFNRNKDLIRLYVLLDKYILESGDRSLSKKELSKSLFPGKRYNDKQIRYLMTDLTRLAEHFLTVKAIDNNLLLRDEILMTSLRERKMQKEFRAIYRHARQTAESQPERDAEYFLSRFRIENENLEFMALQQERTDDLKINEVMQHLDNFYIVQKLKLACEIVNRSNVVSKQYDVFMLQELLKQLGRQDYSSIPAVTVYHHILLTLTDPEDEQHFEKLRQSVASHYQQFAKKELRDIFQYVLNYSIRKINLGNLTYQRTLFETYQLIIEQDALLSNGQLSPWDYKNITTISLRLTEFKWAKSFIYDYKKHLPKAEQENAFVYNLANLHFRQGRFEDTLELLQKVDYTDVYYKLDSRSMLLKTYYELDYTDLFFYHVTSFRTLLRRDKTISEYQRTIYINLVKFTAKLMRNRGRKKKIELLIKQMEATPQIADIQWLKAKVDEIIPY